MKSPLVRNVLLTLGIGIFVTALCSWFSLEKVPANEDKKAALNVPPTLSLKTDDYQPATARDIKRSRELSGKRSSEAADLIPILPKATGIPPIHYLSAVHHKDGTQVSGLPGQGDKLGEHRHHWKDDTPSIAGQFHELAWRLDQQPWSSWKQYAILFVTRSTVSTCTRWLIARMSGRETPWS